MDTRRIIITISVPFLLVLIRWIVVGIGHKLFPAPFGKPSARFDPAKTIAYLGWDFAGIGLGFYLAALLSSDSVLAAWRNSSGGDVGGENLRIIVSFCIFVGFYIAAVFIRFCLLENWRDLEIVHRCLYGLLLWVLGFVIMASTSALAVKVVKHPPTAAVAQLTQESKF
jgi:hypothetical protein